MESQFGLAHVWAQGDWVSKSIVVFLLIMSIASWLVICCAPCRFGAANAKPHKRVSFGTTANLTQP